MNNLFNDVPLGTYNPDISARLNTPPIEPSARESGIAVRDEAIAQVAAGADVRFMALALDAVKRCAESTPEFTTDACVLLCAMTAKEPRAWGAVMTRAQRDGIVERTDRTRESDNPTNHRRPMRVWRSLVFQGGGA